MERLNVSGMRLGWLVIGLAVAARAAAAEVPAQGAAEHAAEMVDASNAQRLSDVAHVPMTPQTRAQARQRRGSGTPPGAVAGPDNRASQRAVCQAQCNLERQACDQGRDSFRDRRDQITSYNSSCYLAVSSCLSRC